MVQVKDEIMSTRTTIDFFSNSHPPAYPDNIGYFKFLGLLTQKETDTKTTYGSI